MIVIGLTLLRESEDRGDPFPSFCRKRLCFPLLSALLAMGLFVGTLSGFFRIGGGVLIVPVRGSIAEKSARTEQLFFELDPFAPAPKEGRSGPPAKTDCNLSVRRSKTHEDIFFYSNVRL